MRSQSVEKEAELVSLMDYLVEEFESCPKVRVRLRQLATTERSPDLVQDYDPHANDLHEARGVVVQVNSREYFFPSTWASARNRSLVDRHVEEIRETLR